MTSLPVGGTTGLCHETTAAIDDAADGLPSIARSFAPNFGRLFLLCANSSACRPTRPFSPRPRPSDTRGGPDERDFRNQTGDAVPAFTPGEDGQSAPCPEYG